jgi:hypothetical protein
MSVQIIKPGFTLSKASILFLLIVSKCFGQYTKRMLKGMAAPPLQDCLAKIRLEQIILLREGYK